MSVPSFVRKHTPRLPMAVALIIGVGLLPTLTGGIVGVPTASVAPAAVGLGTATSFGVLAGSSVTNTGPSSIDGDLGVSPGTAITGFPPGKVTNGTVHSADAVAAQAQSDLTIAYDDAAGRAPTTTYSGPTNLGGTTLTPGVYNSPTELSIAGTLTLDAKADPDAVFIFQAGSTLITSPNSRVELINGAQDCNVFWQVGSSSTLGVNSVFVGTILALTTITANTTATVAGRLLARNGAVTLDSNTVRKPACAPAASSTSPGSGSSSSTSPGSGSSSSTSPGSGSSSSSSSSTTSPGSGSSSSSSTSSTTTMTLPAPLLSPTTATTRQATTTTSPATTTTTRGPSGVVTTTTGPGTDVLGEVITTPGAQGPTAPLPKTGSPIGSTARLAAIALMLGAVATRIGKAKTAPKP